MLLKSDEGISMNMSTLRRHLKSLGPKESPVGRATSGSLPAGAGEPVRDASRIQMYASEMHPSRLGSDSNNYTAPALTPRPSRSTTEET